MNTRATTGDPAGTRNRTARSAAAIAGICYSAAWIAGLAVGAPNPSVNAAGYQVVAAFAGHDGPTIAMFVLAEGIAAIALAVVVVLTARAVGPQRGRRAGLAAAAFGLAAALVSWAELAMGASLIYDVVPAGETATAGNLYHALMRVDGAKMFLLAAMAVALAELAMTSAVLPRWLARIELLLAVSLVVSGLAYVLLAPGPAVSVYVAGALLLVGVTAAGVTLRTSR